jgi:hypothetical protein
MFRKKTESMTIPEFMHGKEEKPRKKIHPAAFSAVPLMLAAKPAFACGDATTAIATGGQVVTAGAISDAVKEKIVNAFDPIIELITQLSFPIAGIMITGGALLIQCGLQDKGSTMITRGSIGFIIVQLAPMMLDLLFGIGAAV